MDNESLSWQLHRLIELVCAMTPVTIDGDEREGQWLRLVALDELQTALATLSELEHETAFDTSLVVTLHDGIEHEIYGVDYMGKPPYMSTVRCQIVESEDEGNRFIDLPLLEIKTIRFRS